jgi:hypothetical protein
MEQNCQGSWTSCLPLVFRAAALPKKFKLLIAMDLDASLELLKEWEHWPSKE